MFLWSKIDSFIRLIRILSLDIVAGALATTLFFTKYLQVHFQASYWIILGIIVWLIYLFDHIADTRFDIHSGKYYLREYFSKNRRFLYVLFFLLSVAAFLLLQKLPANIFKYGLYGGFGVVAYLTLNFIQNRIEYYFFPREFIISFIYIFGTAGIPLLVSSRYSIDILLCLAGYFSLVLNNVVLYSVLDQAEDKESSVKSIAIMTKGKMALRIVLFACGLSFIAFLSQLIIKSEDFIFPLLGILMAVPMFLLSWNLNKIPYSWAGILADAIFILPLVFVFLY